MTTTITELVRAVTTTITELVRAVTTTIEEQLTTQGAHR